ncbi:putative ATPase [Mycolicibacterium phlei]|uniref:AAA family ATPase n=1 Tax=Mycobacteroides chelonae TaxID=1774 RepID=UPI000618D426|nr:AAA family ATPase [Mycobacteroides chelonae]VEG15829.1 putative ATPase [Mycolicibacterium phlei]AKC38499.1 ATP-binding protein [Mycobacteroides chelonae]ANA97738.1 ATP-binding protein [Mycobacteroides chelonae CCUG 47445]OLT75134.1 ATP-binding protein [Mycobacteroides chelonae]ORV12781.1 ATP-binding protein [Mycobacteroides chelonae]
MLTTIAIRGYRSLRDIVLPLTQLTVVTGANGTGKSSLYRALQLLADCGRGEIIGSLARQGGLQSAMWAGPEYLKGARRTGTVEPTVRTRPISIELGYASTDFGYLVDLGLPIPSDSAFGRDPEIKREVVFTGPSVRPSSTLVRRTRPVVEARAESGRGFEGFSRSLPTYRSVLSEFPGRFPELGAVRDTLRGWRFYDGFRVDMLSPARQPQIGTRTTVLSNDGSDLAAAIQTIIETRSDILDRVVADAFDGASVAVAVREGVFDLQVQQSGMLRALRAAELSDGTLRFLLWAAALLSPEPPPLMVLNEPETSLHPDLIAPLATLIRAAAAKTQVVVITHANALVDHLAARPLREILAGDEDRFDDAGSAVRLELVKDWGETQIVGLDALKAPSWHWGTR